MNERSVLFGKTKSGFELHIREPNPINQITYAVFTREEALDLCQMICGCLGLAKLTNYSTTESVPTKVNWERRGE